MAELDLYFLRVWRRAAGALGFRAAAKPLDGESVQVFSDPAQLAAYLTERAAAPSPAATAARTLGAAAPSPAAAPKRRG